MYPWRCFGCEQHFSDAVNDHTGLSECAAL